MPALLHCPWIEQWHLLRDVTLPAEQHERFERHLESCPFCQERLDRTEEDEVALLRLGRQLGDPTLAPTDATLEQLLERLQEPKGPGRTAPGEPPDLYFLQASDRPDLLGTLGEYEVQEVIGQGGMGVVLKAFEPALQRLVAIKVLAAAVAGSATARKRFTREAQAAAAVCHDHIVTVHGVHETDGLPYLVMQYVAGESLQDRLDRAGPLELQEVVRIGLQTALGLAAAHARGLIHRDVKPANILLENDLARVKLTDFGLARMVDDVALTQNGVVAGTPEYMSPEQARGEPLDHRADLFSLGSVLYAMSTGASPFHGPTAVAVIHKVSEQEPTPLRSLNPEVPVWLEGFIARLLAKNPADRFQTTSQVVVLLEGFLAHLGQPAALAAPELPPALPPVPPRNSGTQQPRGWWQQITRPFSLPAGLLVACMVTALALGISYWFAGLGGPEPREDARDLHLPLRGIPEHGEGWELIGPDANQCVRFEPEGLRITLPAGFPNDRPGTGIRIPLPARGDFEMTIHYEILTEPEKANAGQRPTKLTVQAQLDRRPWTVAGLARRVTSDKGTQFTTWTIRDNNDNGNRQTKSRQHTAQAKVGRLRLVRTGAEASFYAAEGSEADFTLLPPPRYLGEEDLKSIELVGSTGGPKAMLDVRFTDLRLHMSTSLASSSSEGSARRSARIAFPILVAVFSVLALGVWLLRRRARSAQAEQQATDSDSKADPLAEGTAPLAFRCPGCARGLKARADLAGRKRKCPGCGTVVSVPLAGPAGPSKATALGAKGWLFVALGLASTGLVLVLFGVLLVRATRSPRQEEVAQQAELPEQQKPADQPVLAGQQANKGQTAESGPEADKERPKQQNKEKFPDAAAAPRQEYALNYQEPFKGQPEKPHDFALLGVDAGKHVKFEAEGLRITLPIGKNHAPAGLATTFGVRGDFAITVCYEILEEPEPADAGTPASGTRISLTVNLDRPLLNEAAIRRKVTPTQPAHILTWHSLQKDVDGKPDKRGHIFPVKGKTGRLRLVRTGSNVAYYQSEGVEKEFTLLTTQPFGADDLKDVQIFGQTSSTKAAYDVRITGLHIAAASLVRNRRGQIRGLGEPTMPAPLSIEGKSAKPASAPVGLHFACPSCGKNLRATASPSTRRVKCPCCCQGLTVPGVQPTASTRAPVRTIPIRAVVVLTIVVVACALYANLSFAVTNKTDYRYFPPFLHHVNGNGNWGLGGEYFHIAQALAAGQGFADPFGSRTGPTAWQPPILPTFLACLLWLSDGSRPFVIAVVVCLNILVLIWTGLLVLTLARQTTSRVGAGLATLIFLLAMLCQFNHCFQRAHDGWLVLLSLDLQLAGLCWLRPLQSGQWAGFSLLRCAGWGLFGGLSAQVSPVVGFSWGMLSVLVGLRQRARSRLALTLLVAGMTLAPWTIRNYLVLGRLVPLKSNLAFEAYQSQCLQPDGLLQNFKGHPGRANGPEGREYRTLGEIAYLERKREQFWEAVRADPPEFLDRVASRVLAATVWYVPFNRDNEAKQPWILWLGRLTHPLPFLALLVLFVTAGSKPLHGTQWLVIGLYVFHLLPYVLVSYYARYAGPLLAVKTLLVLWGTDRLLGLWSRDTAAFG